MSLKYLYFKDENLKLTSLKEVHFKEDSREVVGLNLIGKENGILVFSQAEIKTEFKYKVWTFNISEKYKIIKTEEGTIYLEFLEKDDKFAKQVFNTLHSRRRGEMLIFLIP